MCGGRRFERKRRFLQDGGASFDARGLLPTQGHVGHLEPPVGRVRRGSIEDDEGLKRYEILCRLRERETKAAADKATKLRLTNQSRYVPNVAGTAAKNSTAAARPWDIAANG
jgi:hypothetical protein